MRLILPESMDSPTIPESFVRGLRDIDSGLVIYWNRFKNRFIVDRCIKPGQHTHDQTCERSNVLIVEDEQGMFMMPCDRILDRIKGMDAWTKYGSAEKQRKAREDAKAEWDQKNAAQIKENFRLACMDDKNQIQEALTLIQRHDVARPHK
jgi:hypothetical protein